MSNMMAQDPQEQQQRSRTPTTITTSSSPSEVKGVPSSCTTVATAAAIAVSYEDHSAVQPEDLSPRTSMGGGLGRPIFPTKLYDLLNDCYYDDEKSVYWHDHGRSFIVIDTRGFAERVMKKYFKLTQYASFLRQLSLYGFKRLEKEPDKAGYYHPKFLRGKRFLAQTIKRPSTASSSPAAKGENDSHDDDDDDDEDCLEPNLRDYPSMPQLPPKAAVAVSEQGDDTDTGSDEGGQRQQQQRHAAARKGAEGADDMPQSANIERPAPPSVLGAAATSAAALSPQNDAQKHHRKRKNRAGFSQVEAATEKAKARRKSLSDQYSTRQQGEVGEDREGTSDSVQSNRLASILQDVIVNPQISAVAQAPAIGSPPCLAPQVVMASNVSATSFAHSAHPALAINQTTNLPPATTQPNQQPPRSVTLISTPGNGLSTAPLLSNQAPPSPVQISGQDMLYQSVIQQLLPQVLQAMAPGASNSQGQNTNQDVARDVALQILQQQLPGPQGQSLNQDAVQGASALSQILEQAKQTIALAVGQSTANSTSNTNVSGFHLNNPGPASLCHVPRQETGPGSAMLLHTAPGHSAPNSTTTTTSERALQLTSQGPAPQCQASNQASQPVSALQLQHLLQLVGAAASTESQVPSQTANQPLNNLQQGLMQALSSQGLPTNQGPDQGGLQLQQFLQVSQQPGLPVGGVQLNVTPSLVNSSQVINQVPLSHNQTTNQNTVNDPTLQLLLQVASQNTESHMGSQEHANSQQLVNQVTSLSQRQNTHQGTPEVGPLLQQLLQQLQQAGTPGSTLQG